MPGTITISMEVGGPIRRNVSSKPEGTSDERAVAELNRLGLEHFGFDVEDLEAELDRLERAGIRIVLPLTEVVGGTRLAYIEGPDDVLIELVQRP
jgi:catechol 2,3-dioxygenase-like lactoylglutathione lyase family enzyme